ncbi:MAG: hypothetical protein IKZ87_04880 [Actinomycetaceae bacterium]|nr:hypothetical protein [Actinomycetaceae bacterium]
MKKIMFNTPLGLEQAAIDGRKTMTRRFLNVPKRFHGVDAPQLEFHKNAKGLYFDCVLIDDNGHELGQLPLPYEVGEIVAIAQSYHTLNKSGYVAPEWCEHTCESSAGYRNKMFVRADFMPNRIQMTDLWFEHLQDISDEDCLREGIYAHTVQLDETPGVKPYTSYSYNMLLGSNIKRWWFDTPRKAFAALIDKLNGKGTWDSNPWVVVYPYIRV